MQLGRDPVPHVVASIFLVDQHLMNGGSRPGTPQVSEQASCIQDVCDFALGASFFDKGTVDPAHRLDLIDRSRHQDHAIGLDALLLASAEFAFRPATAVDQATPQAISSRTTLAKAELDQAALAGEDLGGELAAVLTGHRTLDALDDGGDRAAVILKLLGAVLHPDPGTAADVLVVGALVGILEAAPAADIVDQDGAVVGAARPHIVQHQL